MLQFAKPGEICPHPDCSEYGKCQDEKQKNLQKHGKTKRGVQRYQCRVCKRTFTATAGTIFYGKHGHRDRNSGDTRVVGGRQPDQQSIARERASRRHDFVLAANAREHWEAVEEILSKHYRVTRGQLDAVGNKGEKRYPETAESGQYPKNTGILKRSLLP